MNKIRKEIEFPRVTFSEFNLDKIFPDVRDVVGLKSKERIYIQPSQTQRVLTETVLEIPSGYRMIIYPSVQLAKTPLILLENEEMAKENYNGNIFLLVKNSLERGNPDGFNAQGFQPNMLERGRQYKTDSPGIKGVYEIEEGEVIANAVLIKNYKFK